MSFQLSEWLNLLIRWFHVIAGVFWIGQTAYFSWLDLRMRKEATSDGEQRVGMVHSGGFYLVQRRTSLDDMPPTLHWFKWEAAFTWISGILLLGIVYHMGGLMVDYESELSAGLAAGIGFGALIVGWVVYDLLWSSPLGRRPALAGTVCFLLAVAAAWGLSQVLSGRAAYIHIGALLGTLMTANVWMRILPAQKRMVAAAREGRPYDQALTERAKSRSKHNTYMAWPVIFIMISNHFPTASYGHRYNWLMLGGFLLVGGVARHLLTVWEGRN